MRKSVLAAGIASVAILAGGGADATSIPFDDLAIRGNDARAQAELLANAAEPQNWKLVIVGNLPDLLNRNVGLGGVILQIKDVPTTSTNSNGPKPTPTTGPVQVPEPGTLLLLLSGLAATSFLRRQWRARQAPAPVR